MNQTAIISDAIIASTLEQAFNSHKQGELAHAITLYGKVLQSRPSHFEALHLAGIAANQQQNHALAIEYIGKALKINPHHAAALSNIGLAFQSQGHHEEAIIHFQQALRIEPQNTAVLYNCGNAWRSLKLYEMALECYEALLQINPDDIEVLLHTGEVLFNLDRLDEALNVYKRVLAIHPDNVNVLNNAGIIFQRLKRFDDAYEYLSRAASVASDYAAAYFNRGNVLRQMNRPLEAVQDYDQVLRLMPGHHEVLNNKGNALRALNRLAEAHACFLQAIQGFPDYADAHWNDGLCQLLAGDFKHGWAGYEWRWASELKDETRQFLTPQWDGSQPLDGKSILLHAEQGYGDTLQFSRYVSKVQALGAKVILEVQPQLLALLTALNGVDMVVARGSELPEFDYHCPLLSLPKVFATDAQTIPANIPYVFAEPISIAQWQEKLEPSLTPRIGIVWAGSTDHLNDHNRSIPLRDFLQIVQPGLQFYALQTALREGDKRVLKRYPQVRQFTASIRDFNDTAALINLMDIVITVDTAVAHLAGAMGKPVWVLLPYSPDWRWLLDRNDSPWYPTARLFRQAAIGDWSSVLGEVSQALRELNPN